MKTLVVTCCPRGGKSRTLKLAGSFLDPPPPGEVEVLDLCADVPDMMTPACVAACEKRNDRGETLSADEERVLQKMDRMTRQVMEADVLVLAAPMYNFSMPAMVKAWFDSIMQRGKTWDIGANGFFGLLRGRRALVITTSGGIYEGAMAPWDHFFPLANVNLRFMGFDDVRHITAAGVNMDGKLAEASMAQAMKEIRDLIPEWYR